MIWVTFKDDHFIIRVRCWWLIFPYWKTVHRLHKADRGKLYAIVRSIENGKT